MIKIHKTLKIILPLFLFLFEIANAQMVPKFEELKALPEDALKTDILVLMNFYNKEKVDLRNEMKTKFVDNLLNFGFNIKYTHVTERMGDPNEINDLINKYNPSYIIIFTTTPNGIGASFSTNALKGNLAQRAYPMKATLDKILENIKVDVTTLKAKVKDADDNFNVASNEGSTNIEKEEFLLGPPADLQNNKLAVVI